MSNYIAGRAIGMPDYNPETILKLEFEHAHDVSAQLQTDRRRIVEFQLLLGGGLTVAALVLAQIDANRVPTVSDIGSAIGPGAHMPGVVFAMIFWAIGLTGMFTLVRLIQLRRAALDSMRSMNRIKEFYVLRYPQLGDALAWRANTVPPLIRVGSISFNQTLLVALVNSLAIGAGLMFVELNSSVPLIAVAGGAAALALFWQALIYFWMLREKGIRDA